MEYTEKSQQHHPRLEHNLRWITLQSIQNNCLDDTLEEHHADHQGTSNWYVALLKKSVFSKQSTNPCKITNWRKSGEKVVKKQALH